MKIAARAALAGFVLMLILVVMPAARGAQGGALPAGSESILPSGGLIDRLVLKNVGGAGPERGTKEVVRVSGQPFDRAIRLTSTERTTFWHVSATTGDFEQLKRDDVLLLRFYARAVRTEQEDGLGRITAFVQHNVRPFEPSLMETVGLGPEWTLVNMPFRAVRTYPKDMDQLTFGVGHAVQTVEIANIELLRFPRGVDPHDLPINRATYRGSEDGAAWRDEALERIERLRVGPLELRVTDSAGRPVRGAEISVRQTSNAFKFGTIAPAPMIVGGGSDGERYRAEILRLCNSFGLPNGLKWGRWSNPAMRAETLEALRWAKAQGLHTRGHVLLWPSWAKSRVDFTAERAALEAGDTEPLRRRIDARIVETLEATEGLLDEWDAVNEVWNNNDFMDILGWDALAGWFRLADETQPDTPMYINDFGILTVGDRTDDEHQQFYFDTIRSLLDAGAPVDGIGVQGHFGTANLTAPDRILEIFDRFAVFGLPIKITEYDLLSSDEDLQAKHLRDTLIASYSHPSVHGFTMWGMWDETHWRRNAPLFRTDWSAKPALAEWERLVLDAWRTEVSGQADRRGGFQTRAHYGTYRVRVTDPTTGRSVQQSIEHMPDGDRVTVTLP